jgi:glycosyltransferase involved in cell wall biosynthesis
MPSYWEGFPRSLVESMACGRPAIATGVGEVPYMLKNGDTGFLVSPGDVGAIAECMKKCLENREMVSEMGKNARDVVINKYTIEAHVDRIQSIYDELG